MNRSTTLLLMVALLCVALVFLFVNPMQDSVQRDNPELAELVSIGDVDAINQIEIKAPEKDLIQLNKTTAGWFVESRKGYVADTSAVSSVLSTAAEIVATSVVSSNPEKQGIFEVNSEKGVEVTLKEGDQVRAHFFVGKTGSDFTSSYVRSAESDEVYLVRGVNRNLFNRGTGFVDRTLAKFKPEDVTVLSLAAADTGWVVTKTDSTWSITSPDGTNGEASEAVVMTVARMLSTLNADAVVDTLSEDQAGLTDPELIYSVTAGGEEFAVHVGNQTDQG
ncbi:MAG: DUF4340 domain-containing protein, partial [Candidatus Eisenbacteria bacterium]|nr:DUF4340 domain-containing protein [Candidatus Eisenbacteria bacterium]